MNGITNGLQADSRPNWINSNNPNIGIYKSHKWDSEFNLKLIRNLWIQFEFGQIFIKLRSNCLAIVSTECACQARGRTIWIWNSQFNVKNTFDFLITDILFKSFIIIYLRIVYEFIFELFLNSNYKLNLNWIWIAFSLPVPPILCWHYS